MIESIAESFLVNSPKSTKENLKEQTAKLLFCFFSYNFSFKQKLERTFNML